MEKENNSNEVGLNNNQINLQQKIDLKNHQNTYLTALTKIIMI